MYGDYNSALKKARQIQTYRSSPVLPGNIDYAESYCDALEDILCYDIYLDGDSYVIKLKFDYLKHHTMVAFPAAILLKGITSKNSAEVIDGVLKVE